MVTTPPSRLPRHWNGEGEVIFRVPLPRAEGGEQEFFLFPAGVSSCPLTGASFLNVPSNFCPSRHSNFCPSRHSYTPFPSIHPAFYMPPSLERSTVAPLASPVPMQQRAPHVCRRREELPRRYPVWAPRHRLPSTTTRWDSASSFWNSLRWEFPANGHAPRLRQPFLR